MKFQYLKMIFFMLFSFHSLFSQVEWNSKKDRIVIPFELSNNLIIIDVEINNVKLSMLLDTGSDKNLLFSFPENDTIEFFNTKKIKINGFGKGDLIEGLVSSNNKLKVKNYLDSNFELLLITDENISIINKLGIPINGIIGYSFFKDYVVELNYQRKRVILHKSISTITQRRLKKFKNEQLRLIDNKPYIKLQTNIGEFNHDVTLLLDSGLGDGLWLFENDSLKCSGKSINDVLGRGLGGDVVGKKSRVKKLLVSEFILKDALVSFPDESSYSQLNIIEGRNGSLGGEVIKRFDWFIDYVNESIYFKPNKYFNDPFNYNMSGIEVQHYGIQWIKEEIRSNSASNTINANEFIFDNSNAKFNYKYQLKPVFEIYSVRNNSPAMRVGIKEGDKILSINGKKDYAYTIQKITDLFQSEEGRTIIIEVDRDGQILKFKFQLEKIL
ncbi:PDZ domain-containing protein [Flavobacterium sp.]|uniref:PDZ domain-containing protein n=1 Tax=Flavobacterium sp. TaxID=239 RepID=UPI003D29D8BA